MSGSVQLRVSAQFRSRAYLQGISRMRSPPRHMAWRRNEQLRLSVLHAPTSRPTFQHTGGFVHSERAGRHTRSTACPGPREGCPGLPTSRCRAGSARREPAPPAGVVGAQLLLVISIIMGYEGRRVAHLHPRMQLLICAQRLGQQPCLHSRRARQSSAR